MAEGVADEGKKMKELEEEITCGICHEHYTEPKILPCLHYYCKECILQLARKTATNKPFSCPECRKETTLPEGGVEEMKTAFFINRFKSKFSALEHVHGKVEVICEGCDSGDRGEGFCRQCAVFICVECIKQHKRMKAFSCHEVNSLEDLKQGRTKEIAAKELPVKECHTHEEPLTIYCFDCNCLICHDCTVTTHRDHKFEFSKVAAPDTKKKLLEDLDSLRDANVNLSHAVDEVLTMKQEVEGRGRAIVNTIQTSFEELHEILENHKKELLNRSEKIVRKKIENLEAQEKNLSLAKSVVQSTIDHTERFVKHCSDNELMSMHANIRSQIKHEIEEHSNTDDGTMEPVEEADMRAEVRCAKALQQFCQTQAKIITFPGHVTESSKLNCVGSSSTTTVRFTNSDLSRKNLELKAHIMSLYNESIVDSVVNQIGNREYSIKYTPIVRGRHELILSVDGQQVKGWLSPRCVAIPPALLGKPIKVINDLKCPEGVCINSNNELLVIEENVGIVKFDKRGMKVVLVKSKETPLNSPHGIATDCVGKIYCIDEQSSKILKCNCEGRDIQVYTVKQRKGPGHMGMAVVEDEVMVCERANKGTIMVYNTELEYVRCIEHNDMGMFVDLSADSQGNLYVIDHTNICIQVFNNEGFLLRSFHCNNEGMKNLNIPSSVHVSGDHVYVADVRYHTSCVFVFTTGGKYLTSLGQYGTKEGQFNVPNSVCVDKDGFIFVSDYGNNRVQCF